MRTSTNVQSKIKSTREEFLRFLGAGVIRPCYQPIVDLFSGEIFGYEVLSRGQEPFATPGHMFRSAERWDLNWELEHACRQAALSGIAQLDEEFHRKFFFLNVSPRIFNDSRFVNGFSDKELPHFALERGRIVIEITEAATVTDYEVFKRLIRRYNYPRSHYEGRTCNYVVRPHTIQSGAMSCEQLEELFRVQPNLDHVVVLSDTRPKGLITRRWFYNLLGSRFGYSLYQKRDITEVLKECPLIVGEGIELTVLGNLAMGRDQEDLYDPVIVTDNSGVFLGTITMKQLITTVIDMEVKVATCANPLTRLPGNMLIQTWLQEALQQPPFTIIYTDLDNFKGYNDSYGFTQGDLMIKLVANLLSNHLLTISESAKLGHVGGDDFIIVSKGEVDEAALLSICEQFDAQKLNLFDAKDVNRGFFHSFNRKGSEEEVPLVTMSLAVLTQENLAPVPHPGEIGQVAAAIKHKIKANNCVSRRSSYMLDRRRCVHSDINPGHLEDQTKL